MNALVITNGTATRMAVIAARTGSELMAGAKAMMIESLKAKLRSGVAHFIFIKKNMLFYYAKKGNFLCLQ